MVKPISLALQGGGSHGAFTWGVLDRLLEEESLAFDGFSGTSAGAMNATVLAYGLHLGGKPRAQELLSEFWHKVADMAVSSFMQPAWWDVWLSQGNMDRSPGYLAAEISSLFFSPYQLNPLNLNPLRRILEDMVDFEDLRTCTATQLFVAATNVRRGRVKVFATHEVTADAVMASACLPTLYQAVRIEEEDYWDGGFMGHPPLSPLIEHTDTTDILLVQINPIHLRRTPGTAAAIRDRINELSFNASLMLEVRLIHQVDKLLDQGINPGDKYRRVYLHHINPEEGLEPYTASSKLNARWEFLTSLRDLGRSHAEEWVRAHQADLGQRSSVDVEQVFL